MLIHPRKGFTLVELLVVIAIIGILVGLLLPAVQAAREAARRMQCSNNVKQLVLAMHNYESAHRTFPHGAQYAPGQHRTWIMGTLPFIEQNSLNDAFVNGIFTAADVPAGRMPPPAIKCPSDPRGEPLLTPGGYVARSGWWWDQGLGGTNYRGCLGSNWGWAPYQVPGVGRNAGTMWDLEWGDGVFPRNKWYTGPSPGRLQVTKFQTITDGTSRTVAIGEVLTNWADDVCWVDDNGTIGTMAIPLNLYKTELNRNPFAGDWRRSYGFSSAHAGGGNFGMCDGSVQFVTATIDSNVYRAIGTVQGAEVVTVE